MTSQSVNLHVFICICVCVCQYTSKDCTIFTCIKRGSQEKSFYSSIQYKRPNNYIMFKGFQKYMVILTGVQWYLIIALIFNSLMTYDVEHLFICLFAICVSSLESCPLRSFAHFLKIRLFIFLLLSFKNSFYILDNSPLSDILQNTCKYFLSFCDIVFLRVDVFNLNEVQLINYSFQASCLWCHHI